VTIVEVLGDEKALGGRLCQEEMEQALRVKELAPVVGRAIVVTPIKRDWDEVLVEDEVKEEQILVALDA